MDKKKSLRTKYTLPAQPEQLELFRLTEVPYTNAFEFYEGIPRFLVGGDKSKYIKPDGSVGVIQRNEDGTALPIKKIYEYRGKAYNLTLSPAVIEQSDGKFKAFFPGIREEIIEFIVFKLAIEQGYFFNGENISAKGTDNYVVFTSVYKIQQELKKRHGKKYPSYNHSQITEAIEILSGVDISLKGESNKDSYNLSPFLEVGVFNKEDAHIGDKGRDTTIYIKLNSLIGRDILAKKWKQIPYDDVLQDDSYLSRWFRKLLATRFVYADLTKSYNIKLSTIINTSGISPYDDIRKNLSYVKKTLENLDIVSRVKIEKEETLNPETNRKKISDALINIYPSRKFVSEMLHSNAQHKRIETALFNEEGYPLLEPRRSDYKTPQEFEKARRDYLRAQAE